MRSRPWSQSSGARALPSTGELGPALAYALSAFSLKRAMYGYGRNVSQISTYSTTEHNSLANAIVARQQCISLPFWNSSSIELRSLIAFPARGQPGERKQIDPEIIAALNP